MFAKIRQDGFSLYVEVYEIEGGLPMSWYARPLVSHLSDALERLKGVTGADYIQVDSLCDLWLRFPSKQAAEDAIPAAQAWMDQLLGRTSS